MPRKVALRLLVGASVGIFLGIGAGTAAAEDIGRVRVDYLSPTLADDLLLGTFLFPSFGGAG